ncbi:MAG: UPF0280 family protein [Rhodospirillaceae bacterium]|nr:UPF0280 family protein [Rhodospirillaceae bacterium]MBT3493132.1 UPF0280 family protein [Rhodospirillaceae bacterium]MBT3779747.1 UPF0280 family protein [Rhodospirillaceae bacterium]MBT3975987.1 UPF0280 family protein [Rhodospirillaceae bacterium]MBT4563480.1 UPF0280 family protein [Rhodospirillaceae bacterium]
MNRPEAVFGADGRLFLRHGPIELIVEMFGAEAEVARAYDQARQYADGLLEELVKELTLLRRPLGAAYPMFHGAVAKAMARAAWPHRGVHITPMAAVAGAVADGVLAAAVAGCELEKGYVNNGGDIAFHLAPGAWLEAGVVADLGHGGLSGKARLRHDMAIRGIATSGWRGRSQSLGIADAVTVLASTAAQADAAATMIANRVDIDYPGIERVPANSLDPDSDLGTLAVTVAVPELSEGAKRSALLAGVDHARGLQSQGIIEGAMLSLGDQAATVGALAHENLQDLKDGENQL